MVLVLNLMGENIFLRNYFLSKIKKMGKLEKEPLVISKATANFHYFIK